MRAARGDDQASACGQLATAARRRNGGGNGGGGGGNGNGGGGGGGGGGNCGSLSSRIKQQTERLLHTLPTERFRCCTACQGSGTRFLRRRRPGAAEAPRVRCEQCEGTGLLATSHSAGESGGDDSPATPVDSTSGAQQESTTVAVVGGGIGGLALALALEQRGVDVTVYERDTNFFERSQGYGLTLQQGATSIRRLGLTPAAAAAGVTSSLHVSRDASGREIGRHGAATRRADSDAEDAPPPPPRRRRRGTLVGGTSTCRASRCGRCCARAYGRAPCGGVQARWRAPGGRWAAARPDL